MTDSARSPYLKVQILLPFVLFLCLAGNGIPEFFGGDDVMNLYNYSERPLSYWLAGLAHFWSSAYYRPFGGVVYMVLFRTFGFHALPFKIFLFTVLLANLVLYFRLSMTLSGSKQIASWALLLCAYHTAFNALYLNFGTIYDVLGYSCFFSALLGYAAWVSGRNRRIAGVAAIVLIYIAGLCFKEMVVTLPGVLLTWNLLLTETLKTERWRWPVRSGLPVLLCAVVAPVYTFGKLTGPDTMANNPAYAPHLTLHQYATISAHYIRQLFYLPVKLPTPTAALWILALMIVAALLLRSRLMIFCAVSIILTQLPVSFMLPRGAFAIYIPFAFWGLYVAAAINYLAKPLFSSPRRAITSYLAAAALLAIVHIHMKPVYDPEFTVQASEYAAFSKQLDDWGVRVPPTGRVLLINDPFPANWIGWDSMFVINLRANTTQAIVNRLKFATYLPPVSEADWYDYVIDYDSGWRLLKAPGMPPAPSTHLRDMADAASVLLLDGFEHPVQGLWRPTGSAFKIQTRAVESGAHALSLLLVAYTPAKLSVQLDDGEIIDEGMHAAGNIDLIVPIPKQVQPQLHTLVFHADRGAGPLFLAGAQLR
jgi:hypothetical protein